MGKQVLNELIVMEKKTGFIEGSFIGENIQLMSDVLHFSEE